METGIIPITNLQLALSLVLLLLSGGVSAALQLGLLKSLLWGAVRTFIQLSLVGYVLLYIFDWNNPYIILAIVTIMTIVATQTATKRSPGAPKFTRSIAFVSLWASSILVGIIVVAGIVQPEPWYSARVAIPLFGMILGNAMNGVSLCLERLYATVKTRAGEIEALLAFGATPWEAVRACVREAVRAGMTPTINSLMVVGIVSLPGMMTGQILSGVDPRQAVRYQIVVLFMVSAAAAMGCLILVGLTYRRLFTADEALLPQLQQSQHR